MKAFKIFTTALFALFLCVNLVSCSNDDEGVVPENPTSPEDNLPEEARAFVGCWIKNDNTIVAGDFMFWGDGTCWMRPATSNSTPYTIFGYWTYNPETKILATTTNNWQWEVTLSNSKVWAGVSISSQKTLSFNKASNESFFRWVLDTKNWKNDEEVYLSYEYYGYGSHLGWRNKVTGYHYLEEGNFMITEDENPDDYTFNYEFVYGKYHNTGKGTITLETPNSPDSRIIMTGFIDAVLEGEL